MKGSIMNMVSYENVLLGT